MPFEKGKPRHPDAGRKKGSLNKKRIPNVAEFLAENDFNPIKVIMDIINSTDPAEKLSPRDRAELSLDLLAYCKAKPKENDDDGGDDTDPLEIYDEIPKANLLDMYRKAKETA